MTGEKNAGMDPRALNRVITQFGLGGRKRVHDDRIAIYCTSIFPIRKELAFPLFCEMAYPVFSQMFLGVPCVHKPFSKYVLALRT